MYDPCYTMAIKTEKIQADNLYCMTPSMQLVEPGQEYKTGVNKTSWKRTSTVAAAYKSLLSHFADHLLQDAGKQGQNCEDLHKRAKRAGQGWLYFLYPQVKHNIHELDCQVCHMPGREGFSHHPFPNGKNPYTIMQSKNKKTWYTMVNLGKDKHGNTVWERAHAILCAARWGVPKAVFDITLDDAHTPHALHLPSCSGIKGGCLNPLHQEWGLEERNKRDQLIKQGRMNKGIYAWNRKPNYC